MPFSDRIICHHCRHFFGVHCAKKIIEMAWQPENKKRFGKGAKVTCLIKYVHPSSRVSSTLQNATANSRLEECTVVGRDSKVVNQKEKAVIIVNHDDFKTADGEPEEIYAVPRWFKIIEEGPSDEYFDQSCSTNAANHMNSEPAKIWVHSILFRTNW